VKFRSGVRSGHAAWTVDAASNAITVTVNAGAASVANPMFEIRATPGRQRHDRELRGRGLMADLDYFATVAHAGNGYGSP